MAALGTALVGLLAAGPAVPTQAAVQAPARTASFSADDYCLGQCSDILPAGENGGATLVEILANQAFGTQPSHADDQRDLYANLALGYPSLTNDTINTFFNDASLDVAPTDVESVATPRSDVTITRDKATGAPHIRGTTRYGTEYGAGWVAGVDRLWLIDVLRHVGRGQLTSFAGGNADNRQFEQNFFGKAPYTEAELQAQIDRIAGSGPRGAQAMADVTAYLAGLNDYIAQARANRTFPGEYVLTGKIDSITNAGTIQPFTATDLVAIAGVIGALFGAGGGGEVQSALALQAAQAKYGTVLGTQVWRAFQEQNDPEAVTTIHNGATFSYGLSPTNPTGVVIPDAGSVRPVPVVYDATGTGVSTTSASSGSSAASRSRSSAGSTGTVLAGTLASAQHGMSNALVVSGGATASGHPVAVFGPQTGYFAPQMLMLEELDGPGIRARGAAFAGLNMYVELGRGQDYSWSATTAGQDIIDTYAVQLCDPNGGTATTSSRSYLYHGTCTPMEVIRQTDSWSPTTADSTAAGSYTLTVFRTKYGLLESTATVNGAPVGFASLRSTYRHEADSVIGFQEFNDPGFVTGPATFQQAAADVNYTFNWFYVDSRHTAYYNSGGNPQRRSTVDPSLPIAASAATEWVGWNPDTNTPTYAGQSAHPQAVDQDYFTNWNNKQAAGVVSPATGDGSVHRGNLLDSLVKAAVTSGTKITRASLAQLMMQAGLTDLRGKLVLPDLLAVIDTGTVGDSATATAVSQLRSWLNAGALRTETASGSHTYANADAIRIMDAWWPLLVQGEFQPSLGSDLYTQLTAMLQVDEAPDGNTSGGSASVDNRRHKGSSFQYGWWSFVDKDLRAVLGKSVAGGFPATYCGSGVLADCRSMLLSTLKAAAATAGTAVYPADPYCSAGDQWCLDTIVQSPLGGIKHKKIGWQNRPTFQQVVEFPAARGTTLGNLAAGKTVTASSVQSASYPASAAVDGDGSTRWSSAYSDGEWLTVDLGSTQSVARVVLRWEAAYGKSYTVDVSTDGRTWTKAATVTSGNGGVDNVPFTARNARYVRMTGVTRGTSYGYSLYEMEVYAA
ncbi:MAG TPA: penicillin acylase family protein [Kineosporiaceae bacterium]